MRDRTKIVKAPEVSHEGYSSLSTPTYRASTIVFDSADDYANRKSRGPDGYTYGLHGTPTTKTLEGQLSSLEGAERTVILPSGKCGITLIFMTVLLPGDHVLIPDTAYPPVRGFCENFLVPRGIKYTVYDPMIGDGISDLFTPDTKLLWMESPGSTTMEFQDIPGLTKLAKKAGVLTGCDNTWATPLLFKPLSHGVDFSMQALTKYVGGHSDIMLGSVSVSNLEHYNALKDTARFLGIGVSPDECQLAIRGLQTLGVRIKHMGEVAERIARKLSERSDVTTVFHPVLGTCAGSEFWQRDFAGANGVFSFIVPTEDNEQINRSLDVLKIISIGASWGGVRSLMVPMAVKGDRVATEWSQSGTIFRLSVGLEDPADLWDDLERFLDVIGASSVVSKVG